MQTAVVPIKYRAQRRNPGFADVRGRVEGNSARASYNFARRATSLARQLAPVDTGYMKSKIEWERLAKGVFEVRVDGSIATESGAYYAIYVEYGTRYMRAQPFFRPAVRLAREQFIQEMKAVFR